MTRKPFAALVAVAIALGACGDDGASSTTPAATAAPATTPSTTSAPTTTAPTTTAPTTTAPTTTTRPLAKFTFAAADIGADYAPATSSGDVLSPTTQALTKLIYDDPECAAASGGLPPPGTTPAERLFQGVFNKPASPSYTVALWAPRDQDAARKNLDARKNQSALLSQCMTKHISKQVPDFKITNEPIAVPAGLTGDVVLTRGTQKSALAKVDVENLFLVIVSGRYFVEVQQNAGPGGLNEADFARIAKLASDRFAEALK